MALQITMRIVDSEEPMDSDGDSLSTGNAVHVDDVIDPPTPCDFYCPGEALLYDEWEEEVEDEEDPHAIQLSTAWEEGHLQAVDDWLSERVMVSASSLPGEAIPTEHWSNLERYGIIRALYLEGIRGGEPPRTVWENIHRELWLIHDGPEDLRELAYAYFEGYTYGLRETGWWQRVNPGPRVEFTDDEWTEFTKDDVYSADEDWYISNPHIVRVDFRRLCGRHPHHVEEHWSHGVTPKPIPYVGHEHVHILQAIIHHWDLST